MGIMALQKLLIIPLFVIILFSGSILHNANASFLTPVEIIDSAGDGGGNTLGNPIGVATDLSGNVFVTGFSSDNAFKITPGGTITEIIDSMGDGGGNTLDGSRAIATDLSGNVFVAGGNSDNAFKIALEVSTAVGGEFIGIDTTSLLLAGTYSSAAWLIPVIVSAIGIGIVIARKF